MTACSGDGGLGRLREGLGLHGDGAGDLATAQHLDERTLVREATTVQHLGRHLVETGLLDHVEVDALVLHAEREVEARQLLDPHVERHVAAFASRRYPDSYLLAHGSLAGGLYARAPAAT